MSFEFKKKIVLFLGMFLLIVVLPVNVIATVDHTKPMEWHAMDSGTPQDLNDIWGNSENDIYAVGDYGTILHYDGTSWSKMSCPVTQNLYGVWGRSANEVYAVGYDGTQLLFDGSTWSEMGTDLSSASIAYDVWGTSSSTYCAIHDYCDDDCSDITQQHGGKLMELSNGTSGRWVDSMNLDTESTKKLNAVYVDPSTGNVYTGGYISDDETVHHPFVFVMHQNGTYAVLSNAFSNMQAVMEIWGSGNFIYFVGVDYDADKNNQRWVIKRLNTQSDLIEPFHIGEIEGSAMDAWGSSPESVFFIGSKGKIIHIQDNEMLSALTPSDENLRGIWGEDDNNVFVVGENGAIWHFTGQTPQVKLVSPLNNSVQDDTEMTFTWNPVPWADGYILKISETQEMNQLVFNSNLGDVTTHTVNGFENYGRPYFWQIVDYTDQGTGYGSPIYQFDNGTALAPILLTPKHGSSTPGTSVRFAWHPFETSTKYYFQLATDPNFNDILIQGNVENTEITLNGFPNDGTLYYWRALAWVGSAVGDYWSRTNGFYNKQP